MTAGGPAPDSGRRETWPCGDPTCRRSDCQPDWRNPAVQDAAALDYAETALSEAWAVLRRIAAGEPGPRRIAADLLESHGHEQVPDPGASAPGDQPARQMLGAVPDALPPSAATVALWDDELRGQVALAICPGVYCESHSECLDDAAAVLALPGLRRLAAADARAAELAALLLAARADVEHLAAERDRAEQAVRRVQALAEEVATAHDEAKADVRKTHRDPIVRSQYIGRAWGLGDVLTDLRRALDGGEQS